MKLVLNVSIYHTLLDLVNLLVDELAAKTLVIGLDLLV